MPVAIRRVEERMNEALQPAAESAAEWRNRLIADHMRRIFLQVYRIVGNTDDAQDLTQEVFIKALQRADQLREGDKAGHWLSRIATNTAIDFLRRQNRVSFTGIDDIPEPAKVSPEESPEQSLLRGEQRVSLAGGLEQLSGRERLALLLRDVEGLPAEEVARQLGCSKATVRSHIANARVKFRRHLERLRG